MSLLAVLIIAVLQGVTELFPVSSLGHAVVLPALTGLKLDQTDPTFLPILVVLHLGTAAALLVYFRSDWIGIVKALVFSRLNWRDRLRPVELIVLATIPAAVLGFLFEKPLRELFGKPAVAAALLLANGVLLFVGERMRRRAAQRGGAAAPLTRVGAVAIGFWQCLAFLPGISRSGATLVGGLRAGLDHASAAHFSFLIATPVILGAGILEIPKLMRQDVTPGTLGLAAVGGVVAGITAYASTWFLMRYFKRRDDQALDPFAGYCVGVGAASLAALLFR